MLPTQAGAAPWPSSVAMQKLCGAMIRPQRLEPEAIGDERGRRLEVGGNERVGAHAPDRTPPPLPPAPRFPRLDSAEGEGGAGVGPMRRGSTD